MTKDEVTRIEGKFARKENLYINKMKLITKCLRNV